MRNLRLVIVATVLSASATPALADKVFAVTPSGAAEAVFPGTPQSVVGLLSGKCIDVRWKVITSSDTEVVCEAPMNFGQSLLGTMLMGNSYSTPPRQFYRFNVAALQGISRVQASGWMELQMAFGQMRRTDFSGAPFHNGAMSFLMGAGGKPPVGTTFPNHVILGVGLQYAREGKVLLPSISSIEPSGPAEKAGLQVGDVVLRVAGKRQDSEDDWLDAAAVAASKPIFEVEVRRAGKPLKLLVARAFRPAWSEVVAPVDATATATSSSAAALSLADELAKLAQLKADGVLDEAQFEAAKRKLLDR